MSESTLSVRYTACPPVPTTPDEIGPCGPCQDACTSNGPIRYFNGAIILPQADITVPGGDFFSHTRYYCNKSSSPYNGPLGFNWWVSSMPSVIPLGDSAVVVVSDPNNPDWFDVSGSDYAPRYGVVGTTLTEDPTAHTLTFTRTANGLLWVTVFNDLTVWPNPGGFLSHTDSRRIVTTATYAVDGTISQLQRSFALGGVTTTEILTYARYTTGSCIGQLQTVTLLRAIGSADPVPISQSLYLYYGDSDPNGNVNDLKIVCEQIPDGMGGWNTIGNHYHRYWLGTESTGISHGLKMHFGPEACRLMFNDGIDMITAADAAVQPYADQYFEFDPSSNRATWESAAVCDSCPGGGITDDSFGYTPTASTTTPGYNVWAMKTVQSLPDLSQIIVYSNYAGAPMLKVNVDPTGTAIETKAFIYSADGQNIWVCSPASVTGYDDSYDDLLHFDSGTGLYEYLNTSTGLIDVMDYYTTTGSGAVLDYLQNVKVRQGQSGSDILVRSLTYSSNIDSDGNAVYPVATDVSYPNDSDPTITITTSFANTYYSGTNIVSQKTTTLPVISTAQNGSGDTYTTIENFDVYRNRTSRIDERGYVNNYIFAGPLMGVMTQQVLNYQSGVTAPGVNVTTDFTFDNLGEMTLTLGPSHTVVVDGVATPVRKATYAVYIHSIRPMFGTWNPDQMATGQGYATGTGPDYTYSLINPVTLKNIDKDGRTLDSITSKRTTGTGALTASNTFVQSDWKTWRSTQLDIQHRTIGRRKYFLIPSAGTGVAGVNYAQTTLGYDLLERNNRTVAGGGTIVRIVFTTPQRVLSIWIGTNDNGATDADPTGGGAAGNNMVMVSSNVYDNGSVSGNGNITQRSRYVSATVIRVTNFNFDFRNRPIGLIDAIGRYFLDTLDNLGRKTLSQGFATVGGTLISQTQTNFDDRSQIYQTLTYAVNITNGAVGNALIGNIWHDPSGNIIQSIPEGGGKAFTKQTFNGVNWVLSIYRGFNTSGTSYTQALTVAGDIIVEQTDNTQDEAGNVISAAVSQRLNDADPTTTGALTSSNARVSYVAVWVDGIDRTIAGANYGAAASFSRPDVPPASSSTVLVGQTGYNDAGMAFQAIDPMGVVNQANFDNALRTSQTIEDVAGLARTTNYGWTLDDLPATLTAVNPITGDQTTTWKYGTTLADSGVARNDLLVSTTYPGLAWSTLTAQQWAMMTVDQWANLPLDPVDVTKVTYNRLGEPATFADQRGNIHTFIRDLLGRDTDDCITTVGTDTDTAVLRISKAYEIRGMVATITCADNATPGAGTIINQVALAYNDFAQLATDQQEHNGAVTSGTPSVQYAHDDAASGSNEIRLNELTYPNGRTIAPSYGASGGISDYLNRVDAIVDTTSGSTTLGAYAYLGAAFVIRLTYPEPEIWLDLWGGTSGTVAGLDLFNQIIDQRWQNNITGTPVDIDRYKYGRDLNSNPVWKANVVGTAAVTAGLDEFYALDRLNRLDDMKRGVLNGTNTGIVGTPSIEQAWTLDPVGNWAEFVTKAGGTTTLDQLRTSNIVNEITNITASTGATWITPSYDPAGNMVTIPNPSDPTSTLTGSYDAWNMLTGLYIGTTPVATYRYDGRRFRIVKSTFTGGTLSETRDFYFTSGWQDIEERVAGVMVNQYVCGIRYIDELICRDDPTYGRLYALQDANFNLTGIADTSGDPKERYLFDPYGIRTIVNAAWSVISSSAFNWAIGAQGLMIDPESALILARNRYLQSLIGWTARNPMEYLDGPSLYEYHASRPINTLDPSGLIWGLDQPVPPGLVGNPGPYTPPPAAPPPPNTICGPLVWAYTGSPCSTQQAYDAAVDAAAAFLYYCSPVRGGLFTFTASTPKIPVPKLSDVTVGASGNVWGGWTIDEGKYYGAEVAGWGQYGGNGPSASSFKLSPTLQAQGLGGWGWSYSDTAGGYAGDYGFVGGSIDGAYFQIGKNGYLEVGIGADLPYGTNLSVGLLIDYNQLLSLRWLSGCNCPTSIAQSAPPAPPPPSSFWKKAGEWIVAHSVDPAN